MIEFMEGWRRVDEERKSLDPQNLIRLPSDVIPREEYAAVQELNALYLQNHKNDPSPIVFQDNIPLPLYSIPTNYEYLRKKCCINGGIFEDRYEKPRYIVFPHGFYVSNGHIVAASISELGHEKQELPCPRNLRNLTYLEILYLKGNNFSDFPVELCDLSKLVYLNLSMNNLKSLPEEIGQLSRLSALDIRANRHLQSLPSSFTLLTALQWLNLGGNRLTSIPDDIGRLTNLKCLELSENLLDTLPSSLFTLKKIQTLGLGTNKFSVLPDRFKEFRHFEFISVGINNLTMIPLSIVQHPRVQYIHMRGNPLRTLYGIRPEMLYGLEFLRADQCDLPPKVVEMVENRDTEGLNAYYAKSVHEIASDASNGRALTSEDEERLLHEATPDDRTMLETHLPATHPYVVALRDRWIIGHHNDYHIFL